MSPAIRTHERLVFEHTKYSKYFKLNHHIPCNYKEYKLTTGQAFTMGISDIDVFHLSNKGTKEIKKMLSQVGLKEIA